MVRELEDAVVKNALQTTYTPSRFEEEWLLAALGGFYQDNFITDVLAKVKGVRRRTSTAVWRTT